MDDHRRRHEPEAPAIRGPSFGGRLRRWNAPETNDIVGIRTDDVRWVSVRSDQDSSAAVVDVGADVVDAAVKSKERRSVGESLPSKVMHNPGKEMNRFEVRIVPNPFLILRSATLAELSLILRPLFKTDILSWKLWWCSKVGLTSWRLLA